MRLRDRLKDAIGRKDERALESVVAESPRCLRHLMAMTFVADPETRRLAAHGIALANRYHPRKVKEQVSRLVWSMDNRANTNATGAPEVLAAIAEEAPDHLLPLVSDIARLGREPALKDGIAKVLRTLAEKRPGEVGKRIGADLTISMERGL